METRRYSLDTSENNRLIRIIRIVFGILCVIVALFWSRFNFNSLKSDGALWITILLLAAFGVYQIFSGLGKTAKYIEIGAVHLVIRNRSIFSPVRLTNTEIKKIELFPLNIVFFLKSDKRILLRFGTTYFETNEKIISEISSFAERNNIPLEIIEEKL